MNSAARLLVFGGALAHAAWNYLAQRASGGQLFVPLYSLVSLVLPGRCACLWFCLTTLFIASHTILGGARRHDPRDGLRKAP